MKKTGSLFIFLSLVFILCGCKTELDVNLFITDIKEVSIKKQPLLAESLIRVEIPSEDQLKEYQTKILNIIGRYFEAKEQRLQHEAREFTSFAKAVVGVTVTHSQDSNPKSVIWLSTAQTSNGIIDLYIKVDKTGFKAFSDDVENEFMDKIKADELTIIVRLQNDERNPVKVRVTSSWVDGQPIPLTKTYEIDRRKSITIKLSKIATANALETGRFPFAALVDNEPAGKAVETEPIEVDDATREVKPQPRKPAEEPESEKVDPKKGQGKNPKDILKKYFGKE